VWRAWIICLRNQRKYLWITMGFLGITAITVSLTIIFRIAGTIISPINNLPEGSVIKSGIDILQIITLLTSLLSNFTATGVVGATAWRHYKTIRAAFSEDKTSSLRTNRILLLVIESGVLYCLSALTVLVSSLIRLPQGTLGDLYTPINVQIAGAYPSIVLLLVSTKKSLSESSFTDDSYSSSGTGSNVAQPIRFGSSGGPQKPTPIRFARNPAVSGGTDTFMSTDTAINNNSFSRPSTEKSARRLSDESFV